MIDIAAWTAERIREETEKFTGRDLTPRELSAAEVLNRCIRYRLTSDPSEAFPLVPKYPARAEKLLGAPWAAGDLASGIAGSEFIYAYLPVRLVEELLEAAKQAGTPSPIAETLTSGATVYFLNNLRQVLDEALVGLAFEASVVFNVIGKALVSQNGLSQTRETFAEIIDEIIEEGNTRRKERVRRAMWEIDPRLTLANLYLYYQKVHPIWEKAVNIFRKNAKLSTWQKIIQGEISQTEGINLPDNIVCLLSPDAAAPNARGTIETTASGLALEHAARACGVGDFRYSTGHLRAIITAQKKETTKSASQDSRS